MAHMEVGGVLQYCRASYGLPDLGACWSAACWPRQSMCSCSSASRGVWLASLVFRDKQAAPVAWPLPGKPEKPDKAQGAACLSLWPSQHRDSCSAGHMRRFAGILVLAESLPVLVPRSCFMIHLYSLAVEPEKLGNRRQARLYRSVGPAFDAVLRSSSPVRVSYDTGRHPCWSPAMQGEAAHTQQLCLTHPHLLTSWPRSCRQGGCCRRPAQPGCE